MQYHPQGDAGINAVERAVQQLGWIWRRQNEADFGIDGQIEIVEKMQPTGVLIGVQVKSGTSYFREANEERVIFRASQEHVSYWLRHSLSVIVVLHNPDTGKVHWQHVRDDTTVRTGATARIDIPWKQELDASSATKLTAVASRALPRKPENEAKDDAAIHDESFTRQSSTVFFSSRFTQAFPGVRGVERFSQLQGVERLAKLLEAPLTFQSSRSTWYHPIWYWSRGDLQISELSVTGNTVLLDVHELEVDEVAAVNCGDYFQQFVYLRSKPSPPTGLYTYRDGKLDEMLATFGYAWEEYGVYRGIPITRAEFDDGAAVVDGTIVDIRGEASLRLRYLTPYNFMIAPQNSPINNKDFDLKRVELLNGLLRGDKSLDDLISAVMTLPKRGPMRYEY